MQSILMIHRIVSTLTITTLVIGINLSEAREWTDTKGRTISAEYIDHSDTKVIVKKSDGKTVNIPLSLLCWKDRRTVQMMERQWSDSKGCSIHGVYGGIREGEIRIKKADGALTTIPLTQASKADRQHVLAIVRTWADINDRSFVAEFVGTKENKVLLRTLNGRLQEIPSVQLSGHDRNFIQAMQYDPSIAAAQRLRPLRYSVPPLRSIKPIAGIPISQWTADNELDNVALGVMSERTKAINLSMEDEGDGSFATFMERLSEAVGKESLRKTGPVVFLFFATQKMSILFSDSLNNVTYNRATSAKLSQRLAQLNPSICKTWNDALSKPLGGDVLQLPLLAMTITAMDRFWPNERYSQAEANRLLQRARNLPKSAIEQWQGKVDQYRGSETDAALNIVLIDAFFDEANRFNESKFQNTLNHLR